MIHLNVEKNEIKRKVRRIIGKAHIGMNQSQCIGRLLGSLLNLVSCSTLNTLFVLYSLCAQV